MRRLIETRVEPLEDVVGFLVEWRALHTRSPDASFFLSPTWIAAWLSGERRSVRLWKVVGIDESGACLMGVVGGPERRRPPVIGIRSLHLHELGVASADAVYVEYNDFLVAEDAPESAREDVLRALLESDVMCDQFVFRNLRPALSEAVARVAREGGWPIRILSRQPTFEVDLSDLRSRNLSYIESLKGSLRAQIRRSLDRYNARAGLSLKVAVSENERAEAWRMLRTLHTAGWRQRGESGAFSNPEFTAFHQRLMSEASTDVEILTVANGEETIACLYNFICGARAINYQSGFRFEDDNQLKPGMTAHALAAQSYLERGFNAYDFLAGDAQYKRRLGMEAESATTLVLEQPVGVRLALRRTARLLRDRFRPRGGMRQT